MDICYNINPDQSPVATRQLQGDLVCVPLRDSNYYLENVGATVVFQNNGVPYNEDGTMTGLYVSVPQGLSKGVRIRFPFYGRVFGIRHKKTDSVPDFSVVIDGVAFKVSGEHTYLRLDGATSVVDGECGVVVADDLNDGVHYAEIVIYSKASGATTVILTGYLAERRVGYSEKRRVNTLMAAVAVTTSAVAISVGSFESKIRYVEKIIFTNTTSSPITVTIAFTVQIWKKIIPADDTVELDLRGTALTANVTVMASATGVNYSVLGGV